EDKLNGFFDTAKINNNLITLKNQMRINSDETTVQWIRNLIDYQTVNNIPHDNKGYEIKVFDTPNELEQSIRRKAQTTDS
ncbi:DNA/RNA helicase domain-containing protein, partial [Staphylococcus pseudintermedius]